MTTFSQLIDEVIDNLQGFTASPDQSTFITSAVDAVTTSLSVDDISQVSRGVAELGREKVLVLKADANGSVVTLAPFGRGYRSTASTHAANSQLTMSPSWPRANVATQINNCLLALYPTIYAVKTAPLFTTNGVQYQFDIPDTAERVVDVRWFFTSVDGWQRARAWEVEQTAPTTINDGLSNTRYISIYDAIPSGATVQVLYATRPVALVNDTDDFATTTGLTDSVKDVVILGTSAWMAQFLDVGRMTVASAEADAMSQNRQAGSASQIAARLMQQYQQRLSFEAAALVARYPIRAHKTR